MGIHPVAVLFFIIILLMHWRTLRRKNILITFITYLIVLVITAIYFVPELLAIIQTPFADTTLAGLQSRASLWETLSLIRLAVLIIAAIILFMELARRKEKTA